MPLRCLADRSRAPGGGTEIHVENETYTGKTRILLTNEPRAYREVIAATLRSLRPEAEVLDVDPESAGGHLVTFRPDMVLCSTATEAARAVPVWVELYPEHGPVSVVSVSGRRKEIENIELRELLELVDQADEIAQHS